MLRKFVRITAANFDEWRASHGSQFAAIEAAGGISETIFHYPPEPGSWTIELELVDTADVPRIFSLFEASEVPPPVGASPLVASPLVPIEKNTF